MKEFPPEEEYFVVNDACHSLFAYNEHTEHGISAKSFSEPVLAQVWDILGRLYSSDKKPDEDLMTTHFIGEDYGMICHLFDFHTTRNVAYYRKLLLDKLQELG
jgi:hypothetical protein